MGQSAYCNAIIRFDNVENRRAAEILFTDWAEAANRNEHPKPNKGDFSIDEINGEDDELRFVIDSMRVDNCVWQCERVREFFKKQPGCVSVEQDVMTCEDSVNWYGDGDTDEHQRRDEKHGLYCEHEDIAN